MDQWEKEQLDRGRIKNGCGRVWVTTGGTGQCLKAVDGQHDTPQPLVLVSWLQFATVGLHFKQMDKDSQGHDKDQTTHWCPER